MAGDGARVTARAAASRPHLTRESWLVNIGVPPFRQLTVGRCGARYEGNSAIGRGSDQPCSGRCSARPLAAASGSSQGCGTYGAELPQLQCGTGACAITSTPG